MSAIQYATSYVMRAIPRMILKIGLLPKNTYAFLPVSEEQALYDQVIFPIVLADINHVTGQNQLIPLTNAATTRLGATTLLFHIPNTTLGDRKLNAVYEVGFIPNFNGVFGQLDNAIYNNSCGATETNIQLQKLYNTQTPSYIPVSAHCKLINSETIFAEFYGMATSPNVARVSLMHDHNLSNIQPKSHRVFAELCLLATKQYIYNNTILTLDGGFIEHGMEYPTVKAIIEEYRDASEMYNELLNGRWRQVCALADSHRHASTLRSQIPFNI